MYLDIFLWSPWKPLTVCYCQYFDFPSLCDPQPKTQIPTEDIKCGSNSFVGAYFQPQSFVLLCIDGNRMAFVGYKLQRPYSS